jgi:hypothetical protein
MEHKSFVRVYADLEARFLLTEDTHSTVIGEEWDDLDDGDDGWESLLDRVEERFGDGWKLVVVYQNHLVGRCFTRQRHLLGDQEFQLSVDIGQRLYLYGCEDLDAVSSSFVGSICYESTLDTDSPHNWHIGGRDENVMKILAPLLEEKPFNLEKCIVVRNPGEISKLSWLKLQEKYQCAVWLDGHEDFSTISALSRALEVPAMLEEDLTRVANFVSYYDLKNFSFLERFIDKMNQVNDDIRRNFENRFCR